MRSVDSSIIHIHCPIYGTVVEVLLKGGEKMEQTGNRLNVNRLMAVLSEILSEKHGAKITLSAVPKENADAENGISQERARV